jgi:hypothetical protein
MTQAGPSVAAEQVGGDTLVTWHTEGQRAPGQEE